MVMPRFQHFAIAVVRDMSTVEWFSPSAGPRLDIRPLRHYSLRVLPQHYGLFWK
jgi:hypothetical protein